ncbi:MAG TPA: SusD/RagB family nutrient-binding outer membrane lipoprotein [Gemmatimonadales bacterium]|nr:SusD/RagB family nutrient-binding outer membrane lipoprotein [Gemmatimonadales bacterium]
MSTDPNNPSQDQATANQLFAAFQASQYSTFEGTMAYTVCIWMQQCLGINGRFLEQQGTDYQMDDGTFDAAFFAVYQGGGLIDLRTIQAKTDKVDPFYNGVAKIWEALIISEAADKWGDIPYSEAVSAAKTPKLDKQLDVYAALETLLDAAIAEIPADGAGGPSVVDFSYGGLPSAQAQAAAWVALAHTLKARILLHQVAVNGGAKAGNAFYTQIAVEAAKGVAVDGSQDFNAVVGGADPTTSNGWNQFFSVSGFGSDLIASNTLINFMNANNDTRRTQYFAAPTPTPLAAQIDGSPRTAPNFAQPWVTGEENALILAEAELLRPGGNPALAATLVNNIRTAHGEPVLGAVTLRNIIEEKWVSLFQNYEIWNDYKRTGCPDLTPTFNEPKFGGLIPRRLFYGLTEESSNPNIPDVGTQLANGFRNANDPGPQTCPP